MKKILASFNGKDGSLGYTKGVDYRLTVTTKRFGAIHIEREDGTGDCIYEDVINFLDNWTNIKVIK